MKKNLFRSALALVTLVGVSAGAMATTTAPDFTAITANIDFSNTITAIMGIGVSLIGLAIVLKAVSILIRMFGGSK